MLQARTITPRPLAGLALAGLAVALALGLAAGCADEDAASLAVTPAPASAATPADAMAPASGGRRLLSTASRLPGTVGEADSAQLTGFVVADGELDVSQTLLVLQRLPPEPQEPVHAPCSPARPVRRPSTGSSG
jgi:hypothetical protein